MASHASQPEEDCTCPVCCDLFTDPVVLLCGHSFCKLCIQGWWRQSGQNTCPVCKAIFPMAQPPPNLALRNLSDALRRTRDQAAAPASTEMCPLHGEKHKLFCREDLLPICVVCKEAKTHRRHNCVPLSEAAQDYRARFKTQLVNLKSKLGSYEKSKVSWDKVAAHIQAQQTEKTIKVEFQKLYKFLRAEEAARIDACRKEEAQKSLAMSIKILNLTAEILTLKEKIKAMEEEMSAEDFSFLLNVRTTIVKSKCKLPEVDTPSGALINQAKHIGNLQFSVWKKMAKIVQYITLDPNTACTQLTVSDNLTCSEKSQKKQPYPDNPERLGRYDILGCAGFASGKYSWDVEVGGYWAVGVAAKNKDQSSQKIWGIYMCICTNIVRELTPECCLREVEHKLFPQKVGVKLDYDRGTLSFYDLSRKRLIHTIKYTFTEEVFPYFREKAKLLPAELSVKMSASSPGMKTGAQ
ncbi:unnamed protein product [Menidia menidia]|uniref:(Atlantic silverside) hypothetical protein n=1 Tax=Menidia menidia TaxID=238744 RepID=A0A8S4B1L1_9TELE|nr:unnamed protein product [Menidia menidia]